MKLQIIFMTLVISVTALAQEQTQEQAIAEGIQPSVYSHPIGYHGHGAETA